MRSESERTSSSSNETSRIAAALVALLDEAPVDELDRADVEAARRLRRDQHASGRARPRARSRPSAGSRPRATPPASAGRRRGRRTPAAAARARATSRARVEPAEARVRRLVVVVEREVLGQREVEHEPAPVAVLGDVARARRRANRGRSSPVTSSPPIATRPPTTGRRPAIASISSRLAVAVDAGDADDLARAHLEGDAAHGLEAALVAHLQVLDVEQRLARLRRRPCRRAGAPRGRPSAAPGSPRSRPRAAPSRSSCRAAAP